MKDQSSFSRRNFLGTASLLALGGLFTSFKETSSLIPAVKTGEVKLWDEFTREEKRAIEKSRMAKIILEIEGGAAHRRLCWPPCGFLINRMNWLVLQPVLAGESSGTICAGCLRVDLCRSVWLPIFFMKTRKSGQHMCGTLPANTGNGGRNGHLTTVMNSDPDTHGIPITLTGCCNVLL